MPQQIPQDILKLINIYSQAQQNLIKTIAEKEARGNVTYYQKSLLQQVGQILKKLDDEAREWTQETIPSYYQQGIDEAVAGLQVLGQEIEKEESNSFAQLHHEAILALIKGCYSKLNAANNYVGRRINDAVKQAGVNAVAQKIATGQTVKECKKNLEQTLIDHGINGIKDKKGRMISLDAYASTVARSTTREATNTATTNQLTSLGYDLVKMSSHLTTCPLCSVYQGRVYSISGKSTEYPPLDAAFSGEHANIHPNCRHVLMPYIPELDDDADSIKEFSNRSFDIEDHAKDTISKYNAEQKELTRLRNDRDQYQRYKLALGPDAPKSFSGFRRMKYAKEPSKYLDLKSQYKSFMMEGGK